MSYLYELGVLVGRFQPFHLGHKAVIDNGLKHAKKIALFIGSSESPRTLKNPWTFEERVDMIDSHYLASSKIHFFPLVDHPYNDTQWMRQIQQRVNDYNIPNDKICLLGHKKDVGTTRYLNMFPQWTPVGIQNPLIINATDIRHTIWKYKSHLPYYRDLVPDSTWDFLNQFSYDSGFDYVNEEFRFQEKHDKMWENSPFPPKFITVDNVVVQSGHVLMIRRKNHPGKGLWALPGGYLNKERIFDGAIRELYEETKLKVPLDALKGSFIESQVFDDPDRSTRGHIVTHAHLFKLKDGGKLPRIKGADDADKAVWRLFADIKRSECFEDHYEIIQIMINKLIGDKRQ